MWCIIMINSLTDDVIACFLTVAAVLTVMHVGNSPGDSEQPTQFSTIIHNEIVVKAGDYQSHYSLETPVSEAFLVAAVYPKKRRRHPVEDYNSQFVTFSPKATRIYIKNMPVRKIAPQVF